MNSAATDHKENHFLVSFDPATGNELGRIGIDSAAEVVEMVDRSRQCFQQWRRTSFAERKRLMMKAREVILEEMDEIAGLISAESGKPVAEALALEIAPALDLMQWAARETEKMLKPRKIGIGLFSLMGRSSKIIYQPLGVIGIIPAWNYPFSIPIGEAAMALMAGNTVVIKPSELTPLVGLKIGEIFKKAGFPKNAVQIVSGAGETGAALVDARPDKIVFTGSVATGKKIAEAAAKDLIPFVLELGGKDPMIVLEDADLDAAANVAVWGAFSNAGQNCASVERLFVHERIAEELTRRIIEKTKRLKLGRGTDPDVSIGPMSSERQVRIVEKHVNDFREAGAVIETGGERDPEKGELFYKPTVITGARNEIRPMQEETFGPTLPICTFTTDEEAVALANDTEFGLTASVWTRDISRGEKLAEKIEAGTVCINEHLYTHGIGQTPWGGFKNSGRGRTHGQEGLMELVQPQHIHTNRITLLPDAWWMPYSATAIQTFRQFATKFASGSLFKTAKMLPQLLKRIREIRRG
ncbi:aldehyde dehydrogenase family protein [Leptolyngbya sp. 7M]|uniref:aldehyde dehydrogenase family protein n=1 Tax=Leptolyngbya sp. 7M TaxID=2812896 RepID=UPI001B8D602D|nr:aldehyde dehydrogenase family protein [Leptolyngbya sp. 7M]QYO66859.1 aldehyde dehydrogenase family protein [Leptolyngbya sp. 7M]